MKDYHACLYKIILMSDDFMIILIGQIIQGKIIWSKTYKPVKLVLLQSLELRPRVGCEIIYRGVII